MDLPSLFVLAGTEMAGSQKACNTEGLDLCTLHDAGILSHLDYYLARAVGRAFPGAPAICLISAGLASNALSQGHVCLDLTALSGKPLMPETPGGAPQFRLPDLDAWVAALMSSGCVGNQAALNRGEESLLRFPLILDRDRRLYWSKYYDFQERLVRNITARAAVQGGGLPLKFIQKGLERCFSGQDPGMTQDQRRAVQTALEGKFVVISGGPGTGKTHVTGMIRSLLEEWHKESGLPAPKVISMAPTGKAAARLVNGATIHAVLKPKPRGVGFVHGADRQLSADLVIVDEASMIDMALMARLFESVPQTARLVLLGDRNQLSPVQAGAVFSDLCSVPELREARVFLSVNFRSAGKSGIEQLARAVNDNDTQTVTRLLSDRTLSDIRFIETAGNPLRSVEPVLSRGYSHIAGKNTPDGALNALDRFRVLCAHNLGDAGTLQVNHLCEKFLRLEGVNGITDPFFKTIVMVTRNDYGKGLFNGDTGVVLQEKGTARAYFRQEDGAIRAFRLAQLPDYEPAFAVTIHKSQGSEFDTVLILIPDRLSPVITRQLLYTGITRARSRVIIAGSLDLICQAMNAPMEKRSNLAAELSRKLTALGLDGETPKEGLKKSSPRGNGAARVVGQNL